jgi:alpha-mannosidase
LDPATPTVENNFYKLVLDPPTGAIAHLTDKSANLDLVRSGDRYKLNEYLYVTGGDPGSFIKGSIKDNRILTADVTLPLPELEIHRASLIDAPQARRFPWGTVVTIHSKASNTPEIVSTITLLDTKKQVNIQNDIEKTATLKKEGAYFAFPFDLKQPEMQYQGATAWVNPVTDMLPGANRQWFTTQGGVFGKGTDNNVAWTSVEAPLITFEDINRGLWPESIQICNGTLFSYVMNNYWYTDTPAQQGGHFTFRYALTSGQQVSSPQAVILTSEQRSPLTAIRRYNMGWTPTLSDKGTGFLNATPAGVTILTIRPLDHGDAYLVRVQNTTSDRVTAHLQFPTIQLDEASLGSVLGDHIAAVDSTPHSVTLAMGSYEIKTVLVRIANR